MSDWMEMHALADGQLEGAAKAEAESKLSDPANRAEFEAVQTLKGVLQSKCESVSSPTTWSKCRERLAELDKRKTVEGFVGRHAWGLSTLFFAIILGAGLFNRAFHGEGIGTGDAARALSGLSSLSHSTTTPSVDMKDWIVPPRGDQLRLLRQSAGTFQGHPVAAAYFEDAKGPLAAFSIFGVSRIEGVEPMLDNPAYSVGKLNGVNCVTWSNGANTFFLVGERPFEELGSLADRLRKE